MRFLEPYGSILIFAALATADQRLKSAAMTRANSADVLPPGWGSGACARPGTSGGLTRRMPSLPSFLTIAGGAPAGARKPVQLTATMSATPASAMVGISGNAGMRRGAVTARPRTARLLSWTEAGPESTMVIRTSPFITAVTDSVLPLYATYSAGAPVRSLNSSVVSWNVVAEAE